jgi:hypothetical protein
MALKSTLSSTVATVLKGTWWVGSGNKFDTNAPAGSFMIHYGPWRHQGLLAAMKRSCGWNCGRPK